MRVLAIGDIHGCLGPLDDLLAWVKPTEDDVLITLGDYVDRGPDTRGVLNRLIELKKSRPVICLRGNHEIMMLDAYRGGRAEKKMWLSVGGVQALGSYGVAPGKGGTLEAVPPEHWHFLENELLPYYESELFIFVHAGVYPDLPLNEQPDNILFWEFFPDALRHYSGKTVICGHTSQKSGEPKVVPGAVCIDTYAHGGGWLTCLDAISGRYWQVDALGRKREGEIQYEEGHEG
jgi:serine/threonine protein phosphatase 1